MTCFITDNSGCDVSLSERRQANWCCLPQTSLIMASKYLKHRKHRRLQNSGNDVIEFRVTMLA